MSAEEQPVLDPALDSLDAMRVLASKDTLWRRILFHKNGRLQPHVVDDIIQESYFNALRALRSGKGQFEARNAADICTWFTRILLNAYKTHLRNPRNRSNSNISIETKLDPDALRLKGPSPEETAILNEHLKLLRHTVQMCPPKSRHALLRFLNDSHSNNPTERIRRTRARNTIRHIFASAGVIDNSRMVTFQ